MILTSCSIVQSHLPEKEQKDRNTFWYDRDTPFGTLGTVLFVPFSCLGNPQTVEIAVFVCSDNRFSYCKICHRLFTGVQVFLLVTGSSLQDDPFDVVGRDHGMSYGTDFDDDMLTFVFNDGNMLFISSVCGVRDDLLSLVCFATPKWIKLQNLLG